MTNDNIKLKKFSRMHLSWCKDVGLHLSASIQNVINNIYFLQCIYTEGQSNNINVEIKFELAEIN